MTYKTSVERHLLKKLYLLLPKKYSHRKLYNQMALIVKSLPIISKRNNPNLAQSLLKTEKKLKVTFSNSFYETNKTLNSKSCQEHSRKEKKRMFKKEGKKSSRETKKKHLTNSTTFHEKSFSKLRLSEIFKMTKSIYRKSRGVYI